MKLKAIPHSRLVSEGREAPAAPPFSTTDAPLEEKKENLYRAIERTQAFLHRQTPTEEVMEAIRRFYPAPLYFVESNRQALERTGLSRLDAFYYAMIPDLTRTSLSQQWGSKPRMDALWRVRDFVKTLYVGMHVECFYAILLDGRGRLIRPALLQRGGVDYAPFQLGQLLALALQEGARYLVLAHNHPGGTMKPSREDLRCTLRAINALTPLRIPLLDHVIVVCDEVVSIRETGLVPAILWSAEAPDSRIVCGWLNEKLNNS